MAGGELDARVADLRALGQLTEAAALLVRAGEHGRAWRLFEEACSFGAAAEQALAAGEMRAAARLAALDGGDALADRVVAALLAANDAAQVRWVAEDLVARADHRFAARLLRGAELWHEAAEAYDRAGCPLEASGCWDHAGKPAQAARVLEAALRAGADADPDRLRVELGRLYARHGKHQAAVRALQQVASDSAHRRDGLAALCASLRELGLEQALRDLEPELRRLGLDGHEVAAAEAPVAGVEATLYGRYRVIREVATTPHARLLEAVDQLDGKHVAVKILAGQGRGTGRDALARFVREAQALNRLRHPSVVPLEAFVEEGPAMVLAWMGGGSLRDLLDREALSPARALEIARALLDALAEAHRLGILHRDIKPSNLLFDEGGAARLADFGAAHMASSNATVTVGEIGTVAYMAPEQRAGRAASVQSDLFGVGVLLFEMLTGALPTPSAPRVSGAHPDLDERHDAALARLLAAAPEARFESALEARRAIESLPWPSRVVARGRPALAVAPQAPGAGARLGPAQSSGDWHDRWLCRDIWVIPLADDSLRLASAFARAGHPALSTVLRADGEARQLWIEAPRGSPLATGGQLDARQLGQLRDALGALHLAGAAHGAVDSAHVHLHEGAAQLVFPRESVAGATSENDCRQLEELGRAGG
jgi:serine/threonine-protein kinase